MLCYTASHRPTSAPVQRNKKKITLRTRYTFFMNVGIICTLWRGLIFYRGGVCNFGFGACVCVRGGVVYIVCVFHPIYSGQQQSTPSPLHVGASARGVKGSTQNRPQQDIYILVYIYFFCSLAMLAAGIRFFFYFFIATKVRPSLSFSVVGFFYAFFSSRGVVNNSSSPERTALPPAM